MDVDSRMLVRTKVSEDPAVLEAGWSPEWRGRIERRAARALSRENSGPRSANVLPSRLAATIADLDVDVVNIHWMGHGAASIEDIGRIEQPVVWTLHDMWAFAGTEHYVPDDAEARWRNGYRKRTGQRWDIDRWVWRRKERSWKPGRVVCPSNWLADCARQSALMEGWPVHVIPYPIELEVFAPRDREQVRAELDFPIDATIIAFGALDADVDPRKGIDLLRGALETLELDNALAVVFGDRSGGDDMIGSIPVRWLGHISDDTTMASILTASDVVVVPSRQDNLPQVAVEAQASGTPVVAFDTAGLPDCVVHAETGYLAKPFDADDLAHGIGWVLADEERTRELGSNARLRAQNLWHRSVVVEQYLAVFDAACSS